MRIAGNQVISRSTERASRTLMLTASLVIIIDVKKIVLTDMQPFGLHLDASVYEIVTLALLLYGMISLLICWLGDFVSYFKWAEENVTIQTLGDGVMFKAYGQYMKESAETVVEKLRSIADSSSFSKKDWEDVEAKINEFLRKYKKTSRDFRALDIMSKLYIVGLHFVIPMLTACLALVLTFDLVVWRA